MPEAPTYAVIRTGGKQYRVEEGTTLLVERLTADEGATVDLEPLLYASGDGPEDGDDAVQSKPRRRGRRGGRRRSRAKADGDAAEVSEASE